MYGFVRILASFFEIVILQNMEWRPFLWLYIIEAERSETNFPELSFKIPNSSTATLCVSQKNVTWVSKMQYNL